MVATSFSSARVRLAFGQPAAVSLLKKAIPCGRRGEQSIQVRVYCCKLIVGDHSCDKLIGTFGTIVLVMCVCVDAL